MQVVDGKPYVRPCRSIPPDGNETNEWITSISTLHEPLTRLMPLAGANKLVAWQSGGEPRVAATLRADARCMAAAIDRVADQVALSLWAGRPWLSLRPMLLVGPPSAGKTHLAQQIGNLSGCGSAVLSFAGVNSNAELAGNPRGFRNPQPCFPAMVMQRTGTANPVIVIDEVEKAACGDMGDPVATLLGLLERSTARRFFDGCLSAEVNLAHVNWVLIANRIDRLPPPLLSRVDVVEVAGPGPEHAEMVVASLWRAVAADLGLPLVELPRLGNGAETMLLRLFRNTRSVRRVRRAIETLVAVAARHVPRTVN